MKEDTGYSAAVLDYLYLKYKAKGLFRFSWRQCARTSPFAKIGGGGLENESGGEPIKSFN